MRNYKIKSIGISALIFMAVSGRLQAQVPDTCGPVQNSELQKVLLTDELSNPIELAVSPDGRIFIAEKISGNVEIYDLQSSNLSTALQLDVFSPAHEGLIGITLDPDFESNHYVYVYYTHATLSQHELRRYREEDGVLIADPQDPVLVVPGIRWNNQHHSAGSLAFGPDGYLYIATGENVDPSQSQGYASVNEADRLTDTQATSANTNDLNGKILRIDIQEDGTYQIPEGNLFESTAETRGEIYAMGMRNPFRITIDPATGWVYWGEPGPDATSASTSRGPAGRDEINRAMAPGFFGWPYFIAENLSYVMDGNTMNPEAPVNNSSNNTGLTNLPPAQPSLIAYEDGSHSQFPALGNNGSRASIIGAVYHYDPVQTSPYKLPPHYDGSLFIMDWARDWIREVTLDSAGNVTGILPFLDHQNPNGPIDMAIGPDGNVYLLEYDANALYHVQYTGTCQIVPVAHGKSKPRLLSKFKKLHHVGTGDRSLFAIGFTSVQIHDLDGRLLWKKAFGHPLQSTSLEIPSWIPPGLVVVSGTTLKRE